MADISQPLEKEICASIGTGKAEARSDRKTCVSARHERVSRGGSRVAVRADHTSAEIGSGYFQETLCRRSNRPHHQFSQSQDML
jgi:hypothetical protein